MAKMTQNEAARTIAHSVESAMATYYESVDAAAIQHPTMNIVAMDVKALFASILKDMTRGDRTTYSSKAQKTVETIHYSRLNGFARKVLGYMTVDADRSQKRSVRTDGRGVLSQTITDWALETGRKVFKDYSYTDHIEMMGRGF